MELLWPSLKYIILGLMHSLSEWKAYIIFSLSLHVVLCSLTRHRQKLQAEKPCSFPLSRMTLYEAYAMKARMSDQEFSRTFSAATSYALFKSYGIPSIARVVRRAAQSAQAHKVANVDKREPDSGTVLSHLMGQPGSDTALAAIARVNYIHSLYRPSGKISDDDLLYTLSLFALEPIRWIERYEWRPPTTIERCAIATFWMALGQDLEIPYSKLRSYGTGWSDGLHWLDDLERWSMAYEDKNMRPSSDTVRMGAVVIERHMARVPAMLKAKLRELVPVILEPRLRNALDITDPSIIWVYLLDAMVMIRKFFIRHFCLSWRQLSHPRVDDFSWANASPEPKDDQNHRQHSSTKFGDIKLSLPSSGVMLSSGSFSEVSEMPGNLPMNDVMYARRGKRETFIRDNVSFLAKKDPRRCPFVMSGSS
ncbi:hypothetical protein F4778DRAFT_568770 [Xylariomycetidae sp. FL2044]|nr:hypothetical protein F4778DRAFT_568770 [Xylariomycetidae sp. FL2044]